MYNVVICGFFILDIVYDIVVLIIIIHLRPRERSVSVCLWGVENFDKSSTSPFFSSLQMIFDMKFIRICESEFLSIVIIIVISIVLVNRIVINT